MKTNLCAITLSALSCLAGTALAQDGTYVSGLLHQPVGSAQLGTPEGRRLPVHNLGSSGQDGVDVQLSSSEGGGVSVDMEPFLSTPGAEMRIRHRGWDGLIYGNHRMISNGDGTVTLTFDYSALGATSVTIAQYNHDGVLVGGGTTDGPIVGYTYQPNGTCPHGMTPVFGVQHVRECNTCPWIDVWGWYCGPQFYSNEFTVTPHLPIGAPDQPGLQSMMITAGGISDLAVSDANLEAFGVQCWGVGQAQVSEECTPDPLTGLCDQTVRRLPVRNLGSSGQDGVAIDLGNDVGGVGITLNRDRCCPGHVTLMKLTDDEGQEQRISKTVVDVSPDGSVSEAINADFSGLGADGYTLTCVDAGGVVVGPSGGTAIINGGPQPVCTGRCPEGIETWQNQGTTANPIWVFIGCEGSMNMTLPGGTVLTGVASYTITPLGSTHQGRLRHVVITKNGTEMELRRVTTTPFVGGSPCGTADFDGDGDIGTDADIEAFFACLGGQCCPTCDPHGADFDGDGDIGTDADIESFFRVLAGGPC
jgi:hypothetical protein